MLNRYFKLKEENSDFLYANIAVKNINFALISLDYIFNHHDFNFGIYHDEHTFYFFYIQSLLNACGNISNIFYNNSFLNKQAAARSQRLRSLLNIYKADFPLVFQKEVRNTNAHFDERYEQFKGCIGDYNLLEKNTDSFMRGVILTNPHLRTYDKEKGVYITYNQKMKRIEYNLHNLYNEMLEMHKRINSNPILNAGWVDSLPSEELK